MSGEYEAPAAAKRTLPASDEAPAEAADTDALTEVPAKKTKTKKE